MPSRRDFLRGAVASIAAIAIPVKMKPLSQDLFCDVITVTGSAWAPIAIEGEFVALRRAAETRIAQAFGISEQVLGRTSASSGSSVAPDA